MDPKKLKTAYHETAHAVMAILCGLKIRRISIKGTQNYHGFMSTEPPERKVMNPDDALREVRVSLAGFAGEKMIVGDHNIFSTHSDLTSAIELVEDMLKFDEGFKNYAAGLAATCPGTLPFIENPLVRAYVEGKLNWCFQRLTPYGPTIKAVAEKLYETEELTGDEILAIVSSSMRPEK